MNLRSSSKPGKQAGLLAIAAVLSFLVLILLSLTLGPGDESSTASEVARLIVGIAFFLSGFGASISAIAAIKRGDRSPTVWLALTIGAVVVLLLLLEFTVLE